MTDNDFHHLALALQPLAQKFLDECNQKFKTKIIITFRNSIDQDAAKACHKSNASAGLSPHNCMLPNGDPASRAFDFAIFDKDGSYVTDGTDSRYTIAGNIAEELGMEWGGRFSHPDYDHIQMVSWKK